jgi:hypothetical protein
MVLGLCFQHTIIIHDSLLDSRLSSIPAKFLVELSKRQSGSRVSIGTPFVALMALIGKPTTGTALCYHRSVTVPLASIQNHLLDSFFVRRTIEGLALLPVTRPDMI